MLHNAAEAGDEELLKTVLFQASDPQAQVCMQPSLIVMHLNAMHHALCAMLQGQMLPPSVLPAMLNLQDFRSCSPLHLAVLNGASLIPGLLRSEASKRPFPTCIHSSLNAVSNPRLSRDVWLWGVHSGATQSCPQP